MKNNLKLLLPMLALVCTSWTAQAQTDLKISPFSIIFGRMVLRGEFAAAENFGVELLGGAAWNTYNFDDEGDVKFNNYTWARTAATISTQAKGSTNFTSAATSNMPEAKEPTTTRMGK